MSIWSEDLFLYDLELNHFNQAHHFTSNLFKNQ